MCITRGCSLLLGSATFLPGGGHGFVSEEGNATGVARLNVSFQLATAAGSFMSLANGSCVVSYTLRGGASPSVGVLAPGPGASAPGVPGGGAACAAAVKATPCIAGGFKALWAAAPGDGAAAPGRSVWAALSTSGNATCGGLFGAAVVTSFPGEPQSAAFDPRKALDGLTGGTVPLVWPPSFNLTTTSAGAAALSLPGSLFSLSLDKCVFAYKYTWSPATPAPV